MEKLSQNLINKLSIFTESARGDENDKAIIASFKVCHVMRYRLHCVC